MRSKRSWSIPWCLSSSERCEVFDCAFYPASFPRKRPKTRLVFPREIPYPVQSPCIPSFNLVPKLSHVLPLSFREGKKKERDWRRGSPSILPFTSQVTERITKSLALKRTLSPAHKPVEYSMHFCSFPDSIPGGFSCETTNQPIDHIRILDIGPQLA